MMIAREVQVALVKDAKYTHMVKVGAHELFGDEPKDAGGDDKGPSPFEFLAAALATCTSMTVKMYADRKGMKFLGARTSVVAQTENGLLTLTRKITFDGDLTEDERTRLMEIANKCPVHKALSHTVTINTEHVR